MEIILLRHGKPKVDLEGRFNAAQIKQLVVTYEKAGIEDAPPKETMGVFDDYYTVCSSLVRSVESAEKLGLNKYLVDEVFIEADMPHFNRGRIKLSVLTWFSLLRIMWLFGFSKNGQSFNETKQRAIKATESLIALAEEHKKVILVGHGLMNRLIARQLLLNAWQGAKSPGKKYWSYGRYKKE